MTKLLFAASSAAGRVADLFVLLCIDLRERAYLREMRKRGDG